MVDSFVSKNKVCLKASFDEETLNVAVSDSDKKGFKVIKGFYASSVYPAVFNRNVQPNLKS